MSDERVVRIGILALQGGVREHGRAVERCGGTAVDVKKPEDLDDLDGLIIPGGESTTIGKLLTATGLAASIKKRHKEGLAVFGTCAGLVLMAAETVEGSENLLGLMDIKARRNAFGRQVDSFEADLKLRNWKQPVFQGVFIRAPWIERAGQDVIVHGDYRKKAVLAEQGRCLVSAFHPELTDDLRIHQYFINMAKAATRVSAVLSG